MLQSIVGPPMVGVTDLKSPTERSVDKDFKSSREDSFFGKTLEDKMSSKSQKEKVKESPTRDLRQKGKEKEEVPPDSKLKTEQVVSKPSNKKATVRQQAIQEFMDSFESEFEISPTRLVEAMAQLDENQLAQSPESTATAVIDQLGLNDADEDRARAMYSALLVQLNQMPQQQPAPQPVPEMVQRSVEMSPQHMQARFAVAQGRQDAMASSVESLNKKFWMTQEPKTVPTAMPDLDGSLAQRMMMEEAPTDAPELVSPDMLAPEMEPPERLTPEMYFSEEKAPEMTAFERLSAGKASSQELTPETSASTVKALPPHLQGQLTETMSPSLLAALAAKQAARSAEGAQGQSLPEEVPDLMNEFQQAAQGVKSPQVQGKQPQEFFQNQSQGQSMMQQNSQGFAQQGMKGESEVVKNLPEKGAEFKQRLTGLENVHGAPIKGESLRMDAAMPTASLAPSAPVNSGENEAAVKQLMNQAQYLIKKGGGEMKVQMTPEGMGTVHLKVMLQDGKVNLQMSADTQEAKKTIESSLAELKTSLAAHKLSMENVKVDVVNSTSADTATQNQTNMNGQNQRDQARQFWNQFNENFGSQGRRESLTEMPNLKGYGNRDRNPLQPIEGTSQARTRTLEGKGRGLNLVA